jgi:hypothetical protein
MEENSHIMEIVLGPDDSRVSYRWHFSQIKNSRSCVCWFVLCVNAVFDQLSTAENGHWGPKNREKCIIFLKKSIKMQKNPKNYEFYQKNQEKY